MFRVVGSRETGGASVLEEWVVCSPTGSKFA
jgi:hypothetical protein